MTMCYFTSNEWVYEMFWKRGGKNMSFLIKDDKVLNKYNDIWDVIKNKLSIKFHSLPVYDQRYLKTKVREYGGAKETNFLGNDMPKENMHYTCIACTTIGSVMRIDKKNHLIIVYLEDCKYRWKNTDV